MQARGSFCGESGFASESEASNKAGKTLAGVRRDDLQKRPDSRQLPHESLQISSSIYHTLANSYTAAPVALCVYRHSLPQFRVVLWYGLRRFIFETLRQPHRRERQHLNMEKTAKPTMGPPDTPAASNKGRPRQRRATADSQIDRKRELDRIAQRMSRERSRNRIIFLEQKLKSLEARDRGGQISHLMKVIED